jgi:hypothetical protein
MTPYETWAISLQATLICVFLIGFSATVYQIRQIKKTHKENHDWNRRLAAQQALRSYSYSEISRELHRAFGFLDDHDSLPISKIEEKFGEEEDLKMHLHQLLNFYEALARGVSEGVFDEHVIRSARMGAMMRAEKSFRNYIDNRRKITSARAWCELSEICTKWYSEINTKERRELTGS